MQSVDGKDSTEVAKQLLGELQVPLLKNIDGVLMGL